MTWPLKPPRWFAGLQAFERGLDHESGICLLNASIPDAKAMGPLREAVDPNDDAAA
ncbi:MAG TPA: hypothetical protein VMZ66_00410 [Aeromicrobium sp.]|nr:hypothetical protein [Aeromicrobium sp.]